MKWYACALPAPRLLLPGAEFSRAMHWARHAFLNDLQVFSGYLQLGQPAGAAEYLQKVLSRITVDSEWSRLGDPDLEAVLFLVKAEAAGSGLTFTARVTGAPDPAYVMAAAASGGGNHGGNHGRGAAPFALAALAVLRTILGRLAASPPVSGGAGSPGLDVTIDVTGGRLVLTASLPDLAGGIGLEDKALPEAGFVACDGPGAVAETGASGFGGAGGPGLGQDRVRVGIEVRAVASPFSKPRAKARAAQVTLVAAW